MKYNCKKRYRLSSDTNVPPEVLAGLFAEGESYKEPSFLEKVDNRIYFYADVDVDKILQLNKNLRELNAEIISNKMRYESQHYETIYLHLNSGGGSIFDGLAGMDEILKSKVPITTIIDGACASAATFLSVVGTRRLINKHAFMLIHQLTGGMWGKYSENKDEMQNQDRLMQIIRDIYREHTKVPEKKINEILEHDVWWDAKTCLKYGLVDQIL